MKNVKKLLVIVMAIAITMAMSATVFADTLTVNPKTPADAQGDAAPTYSYYLMVKASINGNKVSYFVEDQTLANALDGLKVDGNDLFTVTKASSGNKWNVKLNSGFGENDGAKIAAALDTIKDKAITKKENTKDLTFESDKGYVLVESSLGTKLMADTVVTQTIEEKNTYPTVKKEVATDDANAQIGTDVHYTLTVVVPATANKEIVVTDKMSAGLTFKAVGDAKVGETVVEKTVSAVENNQFTITFSADVVEANQGKTITIPYTATVNGEAAIDTAIPNEAKLKYGNEYESDWNVVNIKTTKLTFDKVDGADKTTKLSGAEFQLTLDGSTPIALVEVEAGKTYRVANGEAETVNKIVTNGNTVTINGLDADKTYKLVETKAPEGYNQAEAPFDFNAANGAFAHQKIENNAGSTLPATGGIGTTIFYVLGALLVVGCGIFLVSRRRASNDK